MKQIKRGNKKGLSPVVATVILVAMVVIIAIIIFLWVRGFVKEAAVKNGQNVEIVCGDVAFSASYSGNELAISNDGSIPLSGMKVKGLSSGGNYDTTSLEGFTALGPGKVGSYPASLSGFSKVYLIPVIRGTKQKSGEPVDFICDKDAVQVEI
jgi:flagellin-like protein